MFCSVFRDVSESKQTEEELKRKIDELSIVNQELEHYTYSIQELKQFAYTASHQLQEPIRTILNYVHIIEEDYVKNLDENAQKYFSTIKDATKRMYYLINTLLEFSRLGRIRKMVYSNCKHLIDIVIADLETLIITSNATIEVAEMPELNLYETEFRQLLQNLVTNAIKYQNKGNPPKM